MASARSSILRRPRASQTASAATASATSHIQLATARRIFVIVWAVSSWLSSMIVIFPADSGSLSATFPMTAYLVAELDHDRTEVEHDLPAVGLDELVLVVQQPHELALRAVVTSTQAVCTRGRSRAATAARSAPERERPARTGANPFCAGGSRSAIAASTSTFAYSWSTAVFATCVRIASFSIMFRETVSNPASSSAVCST